MKETEVKITRYYVEKIEGPFSKCETASSTLDSYMQVLFPVWRRDLSVIWVKRIQN